jgi:hypothetical protein
VIALAGLLPIAVFAEGNKRNRLCYLVLMAFKFLVLICNLLEFLLKYLTNEVCEISALRQNDYQEHSIFTKSTIESQA